MFINKNVFFFFFIRQIASLTHKPIIQNIEFPSCRNCVHLITRDDITFVSTLNKCAKFGEKNIITDEICYDFVDTCRKDELKCGKEGRYFEAEKNVGFKIFRHRIVRQAHWIYVWFLLIVTLGVQFIK